MLRETTVNEWLRDFEREEAAAERRSWLRPLVLGVALGALLATAVSAVAGDPALDLTRLAPEPAAAEPAAAGPVWPERELPREWRWERKPITFDHMFRQAR